MYIRTKQLFIYTTDKFTCALPAIWYLENFAGLFSECFSFLTKIWFDTWPLMFPRKSSIMGVYINVCYGLVPSNITFPGIMITTGRRMLSPVSYDKLYISDKRKFKQVNYTFMVLSDSYSLLHSNIWYTFFQVMHVTWPQCVKWPKKSETHMRRILCAITPSKIFFQQFCHTEDHSKNNTK